MSSIFEECIIVFQVLGHHVRIPCIFHEILMVKSNESNTSSHFHVERNLFFQSLESEVSLLLSVVPLVLPLSLAFCKGLFRSSLCFLFSIVFSCGRSDSVDRYFQSVHQHLQAIVLRASAFAWTKCWTHRGPRALGLCPNVPCQPVSRIHIYNVRPYHRQAAAGSFHLFLPGCAFPGTASCASAINCPPSVSCCNNSLRKHLSPAMSCACLLIFDEQHAPRKTGFQRANGPVSGR